MTAPTAPVREQLMLLAQTRLLTISKAAGYFYDLVDVTLDPTFNILTAGSVGGTKVQYAIQPDQGGSVRYLPMYQLREVFIISVMGRVDVDDLDPLAKMRAWERMGADVEKALAVQDGVADWFQGLCVDARPGPIQSFVGVGSPVVIMLRTIEMPLHRTAGQP